jgi:hypothetical protein
MCTLFIGKIAPGMTSIIPGIFYPVEWKEEEA